MIILFSFTDLSASESSTLAWSGMGSTWCSLGIGGGDNLGYDLRVLRGQIWSKKHPLSIAYGGSSRKIKLFTSDLCLKLEYGFSLLLPLLGNDVHLMKNVVKRSENNAKMFCLPAVV